MNGRRREGGLERDFQIELTMKCDLRQFINLQIVLNKNIQKKERRENEMRTM
jgi:hypothetical protein